MRCSWRTAVSTFVYGVTTPQPEIRGDLIVSAAACMEFAACIPESIDQGLLDMHMDVFELGTKFKIAGLDFRPDLGQSVGNLLAFVVGQYPDFAQHLGMSCRGGDILCVQPPVKANAFGKSLNV